MKKVLSVVLSVLMVLTLSFASATAFAASVNSPGEEDTKGKITNVVGQVNGKTTKDVEITPDEDNDRMFTFTYTGDGELVGWEFPGMVEGEDYEIVSEEGDAITIRVFDEYEGEVIANAIVNTPEEEEEEETTTAKKNEEKTSPKTGAVAASGIAVMGAGVAILAAAKKKEEDAE